jgi:branched-subunit amino acid aminotransferase/4-amino-4-deoxychorismate lyase
MTVIWLNGKLTDENDKIDIANAGGIFETIRVSAGKTECLDLHFARMRRSAEALGLKINFSDVSLAFAIRETYRANALASCSVRLIVAGDIMIECYPMRYTAGDYAKGYNIGIINERRENDYHAYIHKTLANRNINLAVREKMREQGFQEALWLNAKDEICEGIFSNIFIVDKDGTVLTPPEICGLLPGITRSRILQSGIELGLKVEEKVLHLDDIFSAREVFLTSALALAMPIVLCAGHIIGNGKPGEVTLRIKEALERNIFNNF